MKWRLITGGNPFASLPIAAAPSPPSGAFPGLPGNLVGFAATPATVPAAFTAASGQTWPGAYPGSLTTWPGGSFNGTHATSGAGTSGNPWVFAFYDFDAGTGGTALNVANCIFVGCRFQSNQTGFYNVDATGNPVTMIYCSVQPRNALMTNPPCTGFGTWPSASAGNNVSGGGPGAFMIPAANCYQYGIFLGNNVFTADHCDIWGFANAINYATGSTAQQNLTDCWIHDCQDSALGAHQDGPGYLNASTAPQNLFIQHCTVAMSGNTNCLAFQGASTTWNNLIVNDNYWSGNESTIFMMNSAATNCSFTNNVIGTDLPFANVIVYGGGTSPATVFAPANLNGNVWRGNTLNVTATFFNVGGASPTITSGDNGLFVLPNNTLSGTDWM